MIRATEFKEQTAVLAKDQPEYIPLPVWQDDRETISCYRITWRDRFRVLFGAKLWLIQLHFGGPLQPQLPTLEYPFSAPQPDTEEE